MATTFVMPRYALRSVLDSTNPRRAQLRPQWLDGMSDVLADFLRRLRETHPLRHCENPPGLDAYRGLPALASLSLAGSGGMLGRDGRLLLLQNRHTCLP